MTTRNKKESKTTTREEQQISWIQASRPKIIPTEWVFAFFDLPSAEFTRRVRLHRNLKRAGCAMHSQSVYCMPYSSKNLQRVKALDASLTTVKASVDKEKAKDLVITYQSFIEDRFLEVEEKVEELEDAKARAGASASRGYAKRLKKMWDRFDHLRFLIKLIPSDAFQERMESLETLVRTIDSYEQGKLV